MSPDSQVTAARTASRRSHDAREEVRMPYPCQHRSLLVLLPPWNIIQHSAHCKSNRLFEHEHCSTLIRAYQRAQGALSEAMVHAGLRC